MRKAWRFLLDYPILGATLLVGAVLGALILADSGEVGRVLVIVYVSIVVLIISVDMVRDILRGHWGLDVLAVVAMVSTLLVDEYLASLIIVLMISGGEALEDFAARRATGELDALLERAPRRAHRITVDPETGEERLDEIGAEDVEVNDLLLVRPGEVLPVDGTLEDDAAEVDEASLTGEPLPVAHEIGGRLMSGSVAQLAAFRIRATATSANSQFQRIVALVREAEEAKAPVVRTADRFAVPFTILALAIGGVAWWVSGDATRFAEVLVLATPCPLLIAAPVAFVGGMSRASRAGIIVKGGAAVEALANARSAAFDKTGTLTHGDPELIEVVSHTELSEDELLARVASAELFSTHVIASSIVREARTRGLATSLGEDGREIATEGVRALVEGEEVVVGKSRLVEEHTGHAAHAELEPGLMAVHIGIDGRYAGHLVMGDRIRQDAAPTLAALREGGMDPIILVTGDTEEVARHVGDQIGISQVHGGLLPEDKVRIVEDLRPAPSLMVGDGLNDAPVLASAGVGIAMGARGSTAAGESADVIIVADDLSKVAQATQICKDTLRVAYAAIWVGVLLSVGLMLIAAWGFIPAVMGALIQEFVDLAAILYALRALGPRRSGKSGTARKENLGDGEDPTDFQQAARSSSVTSLP